MQCPTNYKLNEFVCECANNFKGLNPLFEEEGRLCCPEGQISSVNAKGFPKCAEQCPKNYVANTDGKFLSNFKAIVNGQSLRSSHPIYIQSLKQIF